MLPYELERPYGLVRLIGSYLLTLLLFTALGFGVMWLNGGPRDAGHCADADPYTGQPLGCQPEGFEEQ